MKKLQTGTVILSDCPETDVGAKVVNLSLTDSEINNVNRTFHNRSDSSSSSSIFFFCLHVLSFMYLCDIFSASSMI